MPDPTKTNWLLIAAIFVAGLFAAAQFGKLTLTLSLLQEAYPDAREWVPSLVSIVGIIGLIFGVLGGPLAARLGLSRVLFGSLVLGAGMSFIQAMMPPVEVFALTRIFEGISHLGLVISGPTLIALACTDRDRPLAMGIWASFFGASLALTALILPAVLSAGGLPLVFVIHGTGMFVIFGVLYWLVDQAPPDPVAMPGFFRSYRRLYTHPRLLIPGAGFVWYTAIYIALIAVLPIAIDLDPSVIVMIPVISIAGTLGAGIVAKYTGPHHLSSAGYVASGLLMIAIMAGFHSPAVLYLLFFLMGAIPTGAFAAIAHFNSTTEDRSRATGGITHFGNIGTTLGTPVMVLSFQMAGLAGVTAMVLLCCAGGLASVIYLTRQTR